MRLTRTAVRKAPGELNCASSHCSMAAVLLLQLDFTLSSRACDQSSYVLFSAPPMGAPTVDTAAAARIACH